MSYRDDTPGADPVKKPGKRKFKLLANPGDIGLFVGLARTRGRLVASAVVSVALVMGVAFGVSVWVRGGGGGPLTNIGVITGMLIGFILVGYIVSMLIADLFFPGRWRERVLLKMEVAESSLEEDVAAMKDYSFHFLGLNVGALLGLLFLSELVTGGFLSYYQQVGGIMTLMRSDSPEDRILGLNRASHALNGERWTHPQLQAEVRRLVDDPDIEVRKQAFFSAGRMQVLDAGPSILTQLRTSTDSTLRAEAATALGRLRHRDAAPELINRLTDSTLTTQEREGVLYGMAFWPEGPFGPALLTAAKQCALSPGQRFTEQQGILLFYLFGKLHPPGASAVAIDWLDGTRCEASLAERCAAAEALEKIGQEEDLPRLKAIFEATPTDLKCEAAYWRYRDEATLSVVESELLAAKVLKAVGNRPSFKIVSWLIKINKDTKMPTPLRNIAANYANALDKLYIEECPPAHRSIPRCRME
jgi:hypothetical protein